MAVDSRERDACIDVRRSCLIGLYHDDTVRTERTILSGFGTLENGDVADVLVVIGLKRRFGKTADNRALVEIGNIGHAVDHDQGRVLGKERLDATHLQIRTLTGHTALVDDIEACEHAFHGTVDRHRAKAKVLAGKILHTGHTRIVLFLARREYSGLVIT